MVNTLVHPTVVADRTAVDDAEQLESAIRYFGKDLPLDRTYMVELLVETLSDGSEVSTLRIRHAERVT